MDLELGCSKMTLLISLLFSILHASFSLMKNIIISGPSYREGYDINSLKNDS